MNALLALLMLAGSLQTGLAKEYSPGTMQRVYSVRIHQGLVSPGWTGGLAATPYCRDIGRHIRAWFRSPVTGQYSASRSLLVVDCSQYRDLAAHLREGLIVEVDWNTARSTGWAYEGRTRAIVEWR